MLSIEFASLSDRGRVRMNNEDSHGQFVPDTTAELEERGVVFVAQFGPLILDFGAWCSETEYGAFASRHPASAVELGSPLHQLGHEQMVADQVLP